MEKEWRKIPGFENYEASSEGEVRHKVKKRVIKLFNQSFGQGPIASLYKKGNGMKTVRVSRIVASIFIGEIEGKEIHHKDLNEFNNKVDNLEILSKKEHIEIHKNHKRGGKKIAANIVEQVISKEKTLAKISREYNIGYTTLENIRKKHVIKKRSSI